MKNFLPNQYSNDLNFSVKHNYLQSQFSDYEEIFLKLKEVVLRGDFTLGSAVDVFEDKFARLTGTRFAIGVGSGTDALMLSLKAFDIGPGDEVITTPYTFYATVGAIVTAGATPVFADIGDDFNVDPREIKKKITPKTRAIIPVHWSGLPCDMDAILEAIEGTAIKVIEDACHGICSTYKSRPVGGLGHTGCFSFHPLKNLNVWGDGGIITTDNEKTANRLRLLRNHGLVGRNTCEIFAYNSRLDTLQAVVADHMLNKIDGITSARIRNAQNLDSRLSGIKGITVPKRPETCKQVFHLYMIKCDRRDELNTFLQSRGIDSKIHYPVPMHLQPAAAFLGHKPGDFPVCEESASRALSLPVHEFVSSEQLSFMVDSIEDFYRA
jgi:aminotransferase EvaB